MLLSRPTVVAGEYTGRKGRFRTDAVGNDRGDTGVYVRRSLSCGVAGPDFRNIRDGVVRTRLVTADRDAQITGTGARQGLTTLVGHGVNGFLRGFRIEVLSATHHRAHGLVELIQQRNTCWDVQPSDVFVGDVVEVLHDRTQ